MRDAEQSVNQVRGQLWLQFLAVILTVIGFALHEEGRLAKIEQSNTDAAWSRDELQQRMQRIEDRLNHLGQ